MKNKVKKGSRYLSIFLCLFLIFEVAETVIAQDLEMLKKPKSLLKGKGLEITGIVGASHVYYQAKGIPNRAVPLNFMYSGNLNVNILDKVKMPVSFSVSNQNINFSHPFDRNYRFAQPFNRMVFKPTYKGFTAHIGTAAMNFSPFTLAGHRFDGLGLEYKPPKKNYYLAAMAGNLQRAVQIDSNFTVRNNRPSYRRFGWGLMAGFKKKQDKVELIFFHAEDQVTSLPYTLDGLNILPMENTVISVNGAKSLFKKWFVGAEIALSGITTDTRSVVGPGAETFFNSYFKTLNPNASTDYLKAGSFFLDFRGKTFTTGFEFKRIDPGYRTLGAYYFNNDLQSWTVKGATQLAQGKVSLSGNLGLQQDNLNGQKQKTQIRSVGSGNLTWVATESLNLNFTYSNFSSFSNLRSSYDYLNQATPYNYLDTLNFRQINQNINTNLTYQLPSSDEDRQHTLSFMSVLQRGADEQGSVSSSNNLSNINLDYNISWKKSDFNLGTSLYYSQTSFGNIPNTQMGPSLTLQKGFWDAKLKTNLMLIYTLGNMPDIKENISNIRYGIQYNLKEKHRFRFDLVLLDRQTESKERFIPHFRELTLTLGYVYNFTVLNAKFK